MAVFTNHNKSIDILYCIFETIVGVMSPCFLTLIHMKLTQPVNQILDENHQLFNILIIAHAFLAIYFMVMFAMISEFGNWFVPILIGAPDMIFSRLKILIFNYAQ
jgi:cytochrome c oxidase subunit 1